MTTVEQKRATLDGEIVEVRGALALAEEAQAKADKEYECLSDKAIQVEDQGATPTAEAVEALRGATARSDQAFARVYGLSQQLRKLTEARQALDNPRAIARAEERAKAERPRAKREGMTTRDAAVAVLRAEGRAMHYTEITKIAMDRDLWKPKGKTPAATMNASLAVAAKKQDTFTRVAAGVFGLLAPTEETE